MSAAMLARRGVRVLTALPCGDVSCVYVALQELIPIFLSFYESKAFECDVERPDPFYWLQLTPKLVNASPDSQLSVPR